MQKTAVFVLCAVFAVLFGICGLFMRGPDIAAVDPEAANALKEATKNLFLLPEPLRALRDAQGSSLTRTGILVETNSRRMAEGLMELSENSLLNEAAQQKAEDMLARQYFAHESPSGESAGELVQAAGYAYVLVGENIAEGNFSDDGDLVDAWMESPGHRENILHGRFTELGVGIAHGVLEGKQTWLAVQEFGLPASACPEIESDLAERIAASKVSMASLSNELAALQALMNAPASADERAQNIASYNALVEQYNGLSRATRSLVDKYNAQVRAFNRCAAAGI